MKLYTYYDKDDHPIAEGRTLQELADKIGVSAKAISHGIHRGSARYSVEEVEDEEFWPR